MRRLLWALLPAGLIFYLFSSRERPIPLPTTMDTPVVWVSEPPTTIVSDKEEIFKRAFWRQPSSEDRILQAARYDWSDEEGLNRLQWYLLVQPSADLFSYLGEKNAFGLLPGKEVPDFPEAPAWFTPSAASNRIFRANDDSFWLLFNESGDRLYATGVGRGFSKGAPEPEGTTGRQEESNYGRLPNAAPPTPQ